MKVFKILNRILDICLIVFFILVFLAGLYSATDSYLVYHQSSKENDRERETGREGNVGWITIEKTNIDYPVMQGQDNLEFLNKDPDGNYSPSGSIFLDCHNHSDFSDSYNLIYGHHMEKNRMFGQLDSYLDQSFFESHRKGILTVGKKQYDVKMIASMQTTSDDSTIFDVNDTDVSDVLNDIRAKAKINEITGSETHLIALSTCKDTDSNERTIVIGSLGQAHEVASEKEN